MQWMLRDHLTDLLMVPDAEISRIPTTNRIYAKEEEIIWTRRLSYYGIPVLLIGRLSYC